MTQRVQWRAAALADLDRIHIWLAKIEGAQPDRAIRRIRAAADAAGRLNYIGRPSRIEGVRELSVRSAPYVIAYRVLAGGIEVLAVYHTAQLR